MYQYIISNGFMNYSDVRHPELDLLSAAEGFFELYRRSEKEEFYIIGRILRRAAHKLYRLYLKMDPNRRINERFLNLI